MFYKAIFRTSLCILLLTIASCLESETAPSKSTVQVGEVETGLVGPVAESKEAPDINETSEVIVSLGDKKLTRQQAGWMQPGADKDDNMLSRLADWWVENELLYEEAERRGITKEPRAEFIAELMKKRTIATELGTHVRGAVEISDEKLLAYYEENKQTDSRLEEPGYLSFSHIRTRTLEDAQAVLERIKAGEDISKLAKELSIYRDAGRGGVVKRHRYSVVKRRFGDEFFETITAAEAGKLVGPVKSQEDSYEVARLENKTEPKIMPFEKVKEQIRSGLQRTERENAFRTLLDSLKEASADRIVKSPRIIQKDKSASAESEEGKQR